MAELTNTKQTITALLDKIEDAEGLKLFERALTKLATGEGNDLERFQALKKERKQLRDEQDKIYNILSYHLGSPLRTLQALSNMVVNDAPRLEKKGILEFNNHLNAQIIRLQELMGNLIEWSSLMVKNYHVNTSAVQVLPLIETFLTSVEKQIENKDLEIEVTVPKDLCVSFDKNMLQHVFNNLISNALKFSHKSGKISIHAQIEANHTLLTIEDEGIGMSASKLKNIFNPARKATQRGTANELGLGMGLIVTKAFLEENGSQIHIESEKGAWTKVSFELELAES
ncbi:MAG: sensor histidine kinase [Flammeovirgaceae bacterium]